MENQGTLSGIEILQIGLKNAEEVISKSKIKVKLGDLVGVIETLKELKTLAKQLELGQYATVLREKYELALKANAKLIEENMKLKDDYAAADAMFKKTDARLSKFEEGIELFCKNNKIDHKAFLVAIMFPDKTGTENVDLTEKAIQAFKRKAS